MSVGKKLDAREERFVEEYLIDLDPRRAGVAAGYSATMANSKVYQWVSNRKIKPHVYDAIRDRQAERSKRTEITQDRVLSELAKIGFSDLRNVLTSDGRLIGPKNWDDDIAGAISSLEVVTRHGDEGAPTEYTHKIKVWDKPSALINIGKHLGMFANKHEHSGPGGGPIETSDVSLTEVARRLAFIMTSAIEEDEE